MSRIWKRNNKWTALGDCVYYHQVRGLQLFMKQPKEKGQTTHLSLEEQSRADRRQVCSCRLLLPLPPLPFLHWTYLGSGNEKNMREYRKKTSFSAQKSPPITKKLSHPNVNREILAYRNEKELDTTKKNANITLNKKEARQEESLWMVPLI